VDVSVISYGATLTSVRTPDRHGHKDEISLGFDSLEPYLGEHLYFGSTIGRVSDRTSKGRFTLDSKEYTLPVNDGSNHLHGGPKGFHHQNWHEEALHVAPHEIRLTLSYISADGEEGYPGRLEATTIYELSSASELKISWQAKCNVATPVNMTNHIYWNLATPQSGSTVHAHRVQIHADRFLPVDGTLVPTSAVETVKNLPVVDFTNPRAIGERFTQLGNDGYDYCYILNHAHGQSFDVRVSEPTTGRWLQLQTTQPTVQFYTGNFLLGQKGRDGVSFNKHTGFCLEPQAYPDALNHPEFPSIVIRPPAVYSHSMTLKFGAGEH